VEGLSGNVFAGFRAPGRVFGVLFGICGRLHCIGATQRGIFWRFGARTINPMPGCWDSVFGLRTRIKQIEMMLEWGMKDEIIPVHFRPSWIHGSIHCKRSGCISFVITAIDREVFASLPRKNHEIFSDMEVEDVSYYQSSRKERN
jgi:hypothetical protein